MKTKLRELERREDWERARAYNGLGDTFLKNKGVLKALVGELGVVQYLASLLTNASISASWKKLQLVSGLIHLIGVTKVALSSLDDKSITLDCGICVRPHGHWRNDTHCLDCEIWIYWGSKLKDGYMYKHVNWRLSHITTNKLLKRQMCSSLLWRWTPRIPIKWTPWLIDHLPMVLSPGISTRGREQSCAEAELYKLIDWIDWWSEAPLSWLYFRYGFALGSIISHPHFYPVTDPKFRERTERSVRNVWGVNFLPFRKGTLRWWKGCHHWCQ